MHDLLLDVLRCTGFSIGGDCAAWLLLAGAALKRVFLHLLYEEVVEVFLAFILSFDCVVILQFVQLFQLLLCLFVKLLFDLQLSGLVGSP